MTVTCDTVRRAFGEFQCCPESCHRPISEFDRDEWSTLCCAARSVLRKQGVVVHATITHPALLRAIEEEKP